MAALSRRPGSITRLIVVLLVVLLVDAGATAYSFVVHRNDPPPLPPFTSSPSGHPLRPGVDAYSANPHAFGFTTTPGRPQVVRDGHVRRIVGGRTLLDPDGSLRYALAALALHSNEGGNTWLERARTAVREVIAQQDGAGIVHHGVPQVDATGNPLPKGWVSARTQGVLLSALSRLYAATGSTHWRTAADQVFDSLLRVRGSTDDEGHPYLPWLSFIDEGGFLWFEQYPQGATPSMTSTGHLFAVIGVYDYAAISEGIRRRTALDVFDASATTGQHYVPLLRYENAAAWTSHAQASRSWDLHQVLVAQFGALARMTGDPTYRVYRDTFLKDTAILAFDTKGVVPRGDVDAYAGRSARRAIPPTGRPSTADITGSERSATARMKPDVIAASALRALGRYSVTGDAGDLDEAAESVDGLVRTTRDGLVPHRFPAQNPYGQQLVRPWYSAQTQGLLLSALVRLAGATGDQRWRDDAGAVFAGFQRLRAGPGYSPAEPPDVWLGYVGDDSSPTNLWFEKYWRQDGPGYYDSPTMVVDAHITAIIGVYDYWRLTNAPDAARLFDGGVSSLLARLPDIRRAGGVSRTALSANVFRRDHHRVVSHQLAALAEMTGNRTLRTYAHHLAQDAA